MKIYKKAMTYLLLIVFMNGCVNKELSNEEMQLHISDFTLPTDPLPGKALVYFVFRNDKEKPSIFFDNVRLSYVSSTAEKVENANSKVSMLANILTLGLTKDSPSIDTISIGTLKRGTYRTIQLDPGFYEFIRIVDKDEARNTYTKLESGKIYFIQLYEGTFYNRYSNSLEHNLYITNLGDLLKGKYVLSNNFILNN